MVEGRDAVVFIHRFARMTPTPIAARLPTGTHSRYRCPVCGATRDVYNSEKPWYLEPCRHDPHAAIPAPTLQDLLLDVPALAPSG